MESEQSEQVKELELIAERLRRLALSMRSPPAQSTTERDLTGALLMNVVGVLNCCRLQLQASP